MTFVAIQGGNDLGWRVETPAKALGARTIIMPEVGAAYCLMRPNMDSEFNWIQNDDGTAWYPQIDGPVVWTRPDLARATHARMMSQLGHRCVAEVDDNYLNPAKSKSGYKFNYYMVANGFDETARLDHMKSCASMDGLIVTTEWLRDEYHKAFKRQFDHSPPIYVCGNHVDLDQWPERIPAEDGRLRVGWMGSPSHIWDIKLAFPAFKWAADQGHRVIFIGYDPQWRRWFDYEHVPWTLPEEYRRAGLPLDVAIAPLRYDRHTMGKSDIKPLEYGMSGAACVAQAHPVYLRSYRHEQHVLFGNSREEILAQTIRVCQDRRLRESLVETMQGYIREERDIRNHTREWEEAIRG